MEVQVRQPREEELQRMEVRQWPVWEKEESNFDWYYAEQETCYFLEGQVEIELEDGGSVEIKEGDLAVFPKGLSCKWHIKKRVKKHYNFG